MLSCSQSFPLNFLAELPPGKFAGEEVKAYYYYIITQEKEKKG